MLIGDRVAAQVGVLLARLEREAYATRAYWRTLQLASAVAFRYLRGHVVMRVSERVEGNAAMAWPIVVIWSTDDGEYMATSTAWPHLHGLGTTREEAFLELQIAIAVSQLVY